MPNSETKSNPTRPALVTIVASIFVITALIQLTLAWLSKSPLIRECVPVTGSFLLAWGLLKGSKASQFISAAILALTGVIIGCDVVQVGITADLSTAIGVALCIVLASSSFALLVPPSVRGFFNHSGSIPREIPLPKTTPATEECPWCEKNVQKNELARCPQCDRPM